LLEKLIRMLKQRGYRLGVIKHHHHRGLQLDSPGKDTWRFAHAGADHVILAGPDKTIHVRAFTHEPPLERVAASIRDVDLILTEGYKRAAAPKIEISRGETVPRLLSDPGELVALVTDQPFELDVPQFEPDDVTRLADLIETRFLE
jgi:molybdopterin-guanine dinucleotide biosynthesis protein B